MLVYIVNSGVSERLARTRRRVRVGGEERRTAVNRGLIGTIVGVLVIIILVLVIMRLA